MTNQTERNRYATSLLYLLCVIAFAYFSFNATTQYVVSPTADLDQSEQLVLSQDWKWGYSSQPPLYTWIVYSIFTLFGPSLGALMSIKVVLLTLLVYTIIRTGKEFSFNTQQYLIAVCGIVFIPQFFWESQRDLTHSVIVAVLSSTTLLQTIRIQRNPTKLNYAILGLFVGMGLLSKYNYALFLAALLVTLAFTSQYRPVIMRYRVVFSFLIAAVIIIPHIIWFFSNMNIATGSVHKLNMGTGNAVVGIGHALFNALAFLAPLLIASVFLFGGNARPNIAQRDDKLFLLHLFIVVFGIVSIFVLATGAQEIKDRWYQPLLFFSPLLLALYAKPSPRAYRTYCIVGVTLALIAAILLPFRTLLAGHLGYIKRPNIPYASLASDLMQLTRNPTTIVAESRLIGGNMRLAFPLSRIITPEYKKQDQPPDGIWLVLCETQNCQDVPFRTWLYSQYSIEVTSLNFQKFKQPYYYAPEREHVLYGAKVIAHQR